MKLVYCRLCHDVFKLDSYENDIRRCKCGKSSGEYITSNLAEVYGKDAVPLCIGWSTFLEAIEKQPTDEKDNKINPAYFKAWIAPKESDTIRHMRD